MFKNNRAFSGFSVDDKVAARKFYTEILGLEVMQDSLGTTFRLPGGGEVFMYEKEGHVPATFTILNFVVDDIDAAIKELGASGVIMEKYDSTPAPQDELGVMRGLAAGKGPDIAWFKDPADNVLSVIQET